MGQNKYSVRPLRIFKLKLKLAIRRHSTQRATLFSIFLALGFAHKYLTFLKKLAVTNALAYFDSPYVTKKSLFILPLRVCTIKLFVAERAITIQV
jgi:hypothetical protein